MWFYIYLIVYVDIFFLKLKWLIIIIFFKRKNVVISNYMCYGCDDEVKFMGYKIVSVKL